VARDAWQAEALPKALVLTPGENPLVAEAGNWRRRLVVTRAGTLGYSEGFQDLSATGDLPDRLAFDQLKAPSHR